MADIDWSTAPEGATHWEPEGRRAAGFLRATPRGWMYWGLASQSWIEDDYLVDDEALIPRPATVGHNPS